MITHSDLITKLEELYPDKATVLALLSLEDREKYLAKLELIEHIKLILEDKR
jgi:hypothetical protein